MEDDEYEKMKRSIRFKQVTEVFKKDQKDWSKHLEELGFTWVDDEDDSEEVEEQNAKPANQNQQTLVDFFESHSPPTIDLLELFLSEKELEAPNYPLFRRYFKQGNCNLKSLISFGLEKSPSHAGLLADLSFFHWIHGILGELIEKYLIACDFEKDPGKLEELIRDFYYHTVDDGYEALYELKQRYDANSEIGKIVRRISDELLLQGQEDIEF